ncbi:MAG TPA: transporter substrate-binding domain-containing protein [Bauldia sp.]|nr:transporter substrate-binding domain-containing protein [Bauldia sp.]
MFGSGTVVRRSVLLGIVAGAMAAMTAGAQAADDTLSKVTASHAIVMGFYNEPPHNWVEFTGGGYKGMDYDMAAAILGKLGVTQIDQIAVDWSGLIPGLQAKRWDMLAVGMSITEERAKQVAFTTPIYQYGSALIVPKGNPKGIKGTDQFAGNKIGAILGSTDADLITAQKGDLVAFKSHPEMIAGLKAGRIDAALADETTAGYANVVSPEPDIEIMHDWQGKAARPTGFSVRLDDTAMLKALNDGIAEIKKDGTLAQILEKYGLTADNIVQ